MERKELHRILYQEVTQTNPSGCSVIAKHCFYIMKHKMSPIFNGDYLSKLIFNSYKVVLICRKAPQYPIKNGLF